MQVEVTFIGTRPRTKEVLQRRMYHSEIQKWLAEDDDSEGISQPSTRGPIDIAGRRPFGVFPGRLIGSLHFFLSLFVPMCTLSPFWSRTGRHKYGLDSRRRCP